MRARHWTMTAIGGLAGFAAVALCIVYAMTGHGAAVAGIGGPFTLVDDTGAMVTEGTLAGKPYAMYFGYTFCPDACPTTLLDLSRWIQKLGPDADKLNYVFVTIDAERDTPKLMHEYLSSFDKHIRGFTGTPEQIAKIAKEYRVYYKKVPTDDGGYVMDHSSIIYWVGPDGQFVTVIPYQEDDASALAKLRNLAATTPTSADWLSLCRWRSEQFEYVENLLGCRAAPNSLKPECLGDRWSGAQLRRRPDKGRGSQARFRPPGDAAVSRFCGDLRCRCWPIANSTTHLG